MTTATTTRVGADEVEHFVVPLAPDQLFPDPANPRKELRDLDALAASIIENGVLEPLSVRKRDEGGYWIIAGHRRAAAAQQAGEPSVPCRVVASGDAPSDQRDRATWRIVENLQRDDLKPAERAAAFQQLLDLGMDEEAMVKATGLSAERVKESTVLAASTTALTITVKYDLTLDQALVLAEFEDDAEAVKDLTVCSQEDPDLWAHTVSQLRQNRDDARARAAATAEAEAEGWTVVPERPSWQSKAILVSRLAPKKGEKPITPAQHKECPGSVLFIDVNWQGDVQREYFCLDPAANGHVSAAGTGGSTQRAKTANLPPAQQEKARRERALVLAGNKANRAAAPVRAQFIVDLLKRKALPPGTARLVTEWIVTRYMRVENRDESFKALAGATRATYVKSLPDTRVLLGLVAHIAADVEGTWPDSAWRDPSEERRVYISYLVGAGYKPSLVEQVIMGTAKVGQLLPGDKVQPAPAKAQPPAKKVPAKKVAPRKRAAPKR